MAVPDFQSFFRPLLDLAADGREHSLAEARAIIAKRMDLSEEDLKEMLPSGTQSKFYNRVAWAKSYFVKARILRSPRRGHFQIEARGQELHKQGHERITVGILNQYPEFVEFHTAKTEGAVTAEVVDGSAAETPEETLQKAYQDIRADLASEVLSLIKTNSPEFFESLVVDLMIALGYGGSRSDAGHSIGRSGDEGIDGIINEDRLGLDVVYLQAKRWDDPVGRPEIQRFVGALQGKRARKGVFITTSRFTAGARDYVARIDPKVVLIDGPTLALLMIDSRLGVTATASYEMMRIDTDYFEEE